MAILKDLIVLGNSRFIGKTFGIDYNDLKNKPIYPIEIKTEGSTITCNRTYAEISQACGNGNIVAVTSVNSEPGFMLGLSEGGVFLFPGYSCTVGGTYSLDAIVILLLDDNGWRTLSAPIGGGDTEEVFVCSFNSSNNTMDKTVSEIVTAKNNGNVVVCKHGEEVYYCNYATSGSILFVKFSDIQNIGGVSGTAVNFIKYDSAQGAWAKSGKVIQEKLIGNGSGQNIKTLNGLSLPGSGDISIPTPTINTRNNPLSLSANGFISLALSGNREYYRVQFDDGISTYGFTFTVAVANKNYDRFVLLDNRINTSDVTVTISSVKFVENNVYTDCDNIFKPSPFVVKAGSFVELAVKILKSEVNSTTGIVTLGNNTPSFVTIYSGPAAASPSLGSDGDIYIQTQS